MKGKSFNYVDYVVRLYGLELNDPYYENEKQALPVSSVTFQLTNDCCCECSYCYQTNKGHEYMTKDTIKKCIDMLFDMYKDDDNIFFNKEVNRGITLEFIGGEPLMNVEVMDYGCSYFYEKCIKEHHPWLFNWEINMISNGKYYFTDAFQNFLKKFNNHCYFNVSIDGPKELHNTCRVYHDGTGNFDDAWKAIHHYRDNYNNNPSTKITIAPENLKQLSKVTKFFIEDEVYQIYANVIYENKWTIEQAQIYYQQLKEIADYLLKLDNKDFFFSIFSENFYRPKPESDNQNWCGGDGKMIAFDPNGIVYPCIRFMDSSLNGERPELIVGDCEHGIYKTEESKQLELQLKAITRRSQSTDECFNCPIAEGCSWCQAWNYQESGDFNHRSTNICWMHRAASLVHAYYWNNYYKKEKIDKKQPIYLNKELATQIISLEEYNSLMALSQE